MRTEFSLKQDTYVTQRIEDAEDFNRYKHKALVSPSLIATRWPAIHATVSQTFFNVSRALFFSSPNQFSCFYADRYSAVNPSI